MKASCAFAAGLALLVAGSSWAQGKPTQRDDRAPTGTRTELPGPFEGEARQRVFTTAGTVVSTRDDSMVVRVDDHGHLLTFQLSSSAAAARVRRGARVIVHYRPNGSTGQTAEEIQVLSSGRSASGRTR